METGTLFWITGLSGAGKTTIGKVLWEKLRVVKPNTVYLDGDILREVFIQGDDYSLENRKSLAMQYCKLCRVLTNQGADVVCATVSLFEECWDWNRKHIESYKEIYIRVTMETLIQRDQKGLYSRSLAGKQKDVMGMDLPMTEPSSPDIVIDNDGKNSPESLAEQIISKFVKN